MTLRSRVLLAMFVPLIGTIAIGAIAAVSLLTVREDHIDAVRIGQQQLLLAKIGSEMMVVRSLARAGAIPAAMAQHQLLLSELRQRGGVLPAEDYERLLPLVESWNLASDDRAVQYLAKRSSEQQAMLTNIESHLDQQFHRALWIMLIGGGAVVALTGWLTIHGYRRVALPMQSLASGAAKLAEGQLDTRVTPRGDREFQLLMTQFNVMAGKFEFLCRDLESQVEIKSRQLVQSQRLASIGYLAAGVAHEINNPLGIIAGYGERSMRLLERIPANSELAKVSSSLRVICEEAFRCKEITDRLLMLSREERKESATADLSRIVNEVVQAATSVGRFGGREVALALVEDLCVQGPAGELKQVVLNLLLNALEATEQDRQRVMIEAKSLGETVELTVIDDGCGIDPAAIESIFQPFYTNKRNDRPGTGLGLSIVQSIVREHGGAVCAFSEGAGKGSRFVVTLPAAVEVANAQHN